MRHVIPFVILAFIVILVPYVIFQPILEEEKAQSAIIESTEPIEASSTPATIKPFVCPPDFEDYADIVEFTGQPSEVDFTTNEDALEYRGKINKVASTGPNFAGSYTAVTWICDKNCQGAAIINAKTGTVTAYGLESVFGYEFNLNSRLFIVNPSEKLPPDSDLKTSYYEVKNDELLLICEKSNTSDIIEDDEKIIQEQN